MSSLKTGEPPGTDITIDFPNRAFLKYTSRYRPRSAPRPMRTVSKQARTGKSGNGPKSDGDTIVAQAIAQFELTHGLSFDGLADAVDSDGKAQNTKMQSRGVDASLLPPPSYGDLHLRAAQDTGRTSSTNSVDPVQMSAAASRKVVPQIETHPHLQRQQFSDVDGIFDPKVIPFLDLFNCEQGRSPSFTPPLHPPTRFADCCNMDTASSPKSRGQMSSISQTRSAYSDCASHRLHSRKHKRIFFKYFPKQSQFPWLDPKVQQLDETIYREKLHKEKADKLIRELEWAQAVQARRQELRDQFHAKLQQNFLHAVQRGEPHALRKLEELRHDPILKLPPSPPRLVNLADSHSGEGTEPALDRSNLRSDRPRTANSRSHSRVSVVQAQDRQPPKPRLSSAPSRAPSSTARPKSAPRHRHSSFGKNSGDNHHSSTDDPRLHMEELEFWKLLQLRGAHATPPLPVHVDRK